MPRSNWKIPYVASDLLNTISSSYTQVESLYKKDPHRKLPSRVLLRQKPVLRTNSRSSTITSGMVGLTMHIHNGKKYTLVKIHPNMVGFKLGEFSQTRSVLSHKKIKKK